jgi:hypothetical protein
VNIHDPLSNNRHTLGISLDSSALPLSYFLGSAGTRLGMPIVSHVERGRVVLGSARQTHSGRAGQARPGIECTLSPEFSHRNSPEFLLHSERTVRIKFVGQFSNSLEASI